MVLLIDFSVALRVVIITVVYPYRLLGVIWLFWYFFTLVFWWSSNPTWCWWFGSNDFVPSQYLYGSPDSVPIHSLSPTPNLYGSLGYQTCIKASCICRTGFSPQALRCLNIRLVCHWFDSISVGFPHSERPRACPLCKYKKLSDIRFMLDYDPTHAQVICLMVRSPQLFWLLDDWALCYNFMIPLGKHVI